MAPRFTKGGKIEQLDGFRKLKFGKLTILMMLKICMLIHGENFKAWTQSDAFKEAHKILENLQQKIHQ